MLDFIFTTLVCTWESIVYCYYKVPYVDYAVYLIAFIIGLKIYTKLFRRKKKVIGKTPIQQTISKRDKLLEIWDELDSDEQEEYKEDMTDDEWLDFRYELIKKKRSTCQSKDPVWYTSYIRTK